MPLAHPPGDAQADFGEALVVIAGVECKAHYLVVDLPHSDDGFVKAFPAETTEAFGDGHNAAFRYFGGVPRRVVYDNTKLAVARILGDGTRQRTQVFSELQSHYLFADRFGRPGKGNDKGKVEGLVGYARRNFFVPIPRCASWDALNADLERQCRARRGRRLRRHTETIGERFARDRAALLPLPPVPYEACDTRTTRVTSLSLVRYRRNDYSVPTAYGHREVLVIRAKPFRVCADRTLLFGSGRGVRRVDHVGGQVGLSLRLRPPLGVGRSGCDGRDRGAVGRRRPDQLRRHGESAGDRRPHPSGRQHGGAQPGGHHVAH